jgi:hypothetical protein
MRSLLTIFAGLLFCCAMGDDAGIEAPTSKLSIGISGLAEPMVGATVNMVATVSGALGLQIEYDWQVTGPKGGSPIITAVGSGKKEITFIVDKAGSYGVTCTALVEGESKPLVASAWVTVLSGTELPYQVQIIPPASSGLPPTTIDVNVGKDDLDGLTWQVPSGRQVTLEVRNEAGELLPSIVQLIPVDAAGALTRQFDLSGGSGDILVSGTFDLVVIPKDGVSAPQMLESQSAVSLDSSWKVELKAGMPISGTIRRGTTPLADAAVAVRIAGVPSTISKTDASGNFSVLSTSVGQATLIVTPPADSGLPVAVLNDETLQVKGSTTDWKFTFSELQAVTVSGAVKYSDLTTPAAQARLVFRSESISGVGELLVGETTYAATGRYRRETLSDAQGGWGMGADLISLPIAGSYAVDIYPGDSAPAHEGHSSQEVVVQQDSNDIDLSLKRKASLSGTVVSYDNRAVSAEILFDGANAQLRAVTDDDGAFSLQVDDEQTYGLRIRPIFANASLAPLMLSNLVVDGNKNLSEFQLPQGVSLSGSVETVQGLAVPNSVIRIWCANSDCPSQETLDQVTSGADGSFQLWVPKQ